MNWDQLFEKTEQTIDLSSFKRIIESSGNYFMKDAYTCECIAFTFSDMFNSTIQVLYGGNKNIYLINFQNKETAISRNYLLHLIESHASGKELRNKYGSAIRYFDFEFMLNMTLASDVSSGFTHFKKSVNAIANALRTHEVYLYKETHITDEKELNAYLKNTIDGFEALFISVDDIRKSSDL
jgi:hypothetical protein